jgi:hypothetical protein
MEECKSYQVADKWAPSSHPYSAVFSKARFVMPSTKERLRNRETINKKEK